MSDRNKIAREQMRDLPEEKSEANPSLAAPPAEAPATATSTPPKKSRKRLLLTVVALAALAGGIREGHYWWTIGRFTVSTDDAYIAADSTVLAAKVSGYVSSIEVADNEHVEAGDVIARIDDGDYRLAVQAERDRIAIQQSTIVRTGEQITAAEAAVAQARAEVSEAKAELERAAVAFSRQDQLAQNNFASKQALDNARADRDKAAANVASTTAAVRSAEVNVRVLAAQKTEAERTLDQFKTALATAERTLSFTVVRAPVSGVVGNRAVNVGQLVQVGTRLAAIVPLDAVYVDANFKETQLGDLRLGQKVHIAVDAWPERTFEGRIESVSPASGSVFSLLPPENATGNFTKIVQRVPVRIRFPTEALTDGKLRPGMSVEASVDTRPEPTDSRTAAVPLARWGIPQ